MLSLDSTIVYICAAISALLIPFIALQKCAECRQLTVRTLHPRHRCPSRSHSLLARGWIGLVLLWTGAAAISGMLLTR